MNKKIVIGIVIAGIFVMLAFVPAADHLSTGNKSSSTGSAVLSPEMEVNKYVKGNKMNGEININSNISNEIGISFSQWYLSHRISENLPAITSIDSSSLFREYIIQSDSGRLYMKQLNAIEMSSFNKSNVAMQSSIDSILEHKGNIPHIIKTGNTPVYIINVRPDLPGGVTSDSGTWVMVSINYFVYHAPWWLGGWSVTYGEHDAINALYAGMAAQNFYNKETGDLSITTDLDGLITVVLGAALLVSPATFGVSALVGGILASVIAAGGYTLSLLLSAWHHDLTRLYESTYANEPSGNKYIWMYDTVNYYYPWVTVVGTFASNFGEYGYLSNGNVVTFVPNIPIIAYDGLTGVAIIAEMSSGVHKEGNTIGYNTWYNTGD